MKKITYKIVFSLVILAVLFYYLDLRQILSIASQFKWRYLLPILAVFLSSIYLGGVNVYLLLDALDEKLSMNGVAYDYILSWAYGLLVPGKVGELSIIYLLHKKGVSIGKGTLIAIIDKLITFVCFFIVALFGILMIFDFWSSIVIIIFNLVLLISISVFIFSQIGRKLIKKHILRRYSSVFVGFSKSFKNLITNCKLALFLNILLTFGKLFLTALFLWMAFLSFGYYADFLSVLVIIASTTIVSLVPVSVGGLGVRESTGILMFIKFGVAANAAGTVFIFYAIVRYINAGIFSLIKVLRGKK